MADAPRGLLVAGGSLTQLRLAADRSTEPAAPPLSALERRLGLEVGSLEGPEKARAEEALGDATTLALAEVPQAVADRWEVEGLPRVVTIVVLKAARREFENPEGYTTEALGEHTAEVAVASGVYLTEDERATIARAAAKVTGRPGGFVGSIRTPSAYERR